MNLAQYINDLHDQLMVAAEAGGDEGRLLAERLTAPLESATRLVLLEALAAATNEITRDLAPGSVELRLRGRDPEFVVTSAPVNETLRDVTGNDSPHRSTAPEADADEGNTSRMTLRLPEQLKSRIERAAGKESLSVNAWLVRAVADALDPGDRDRRSTRRGPPGGQRYTGWAR